MTAAKTALLDEKVEEKTDNKVVETDETKAGTAKDKPADADKSVQNADGSKEPAKKTTRRKTTAKKETKKVDYETLNLSEGPLSAVSGQVTGTLTNNDTAVPVLKLALYNWIGVEPISVPAKNGFDDIRKVLDDLEAQAAKL